LLNNGFLVKFLVIKLFIAINNLGLAAEYGFYYKNKNAEWKCMLSNYNNSWTSFVAEMLDSYTERCEGSFTEIKESSVVWQYRDCDKELGRHFANILKSDLESRYSKHELNVINGKGYTEIKPKGLNKVIINLNFSKGCFASFILRNNMFEKFYPDLIICIGDDTSDEEMFRYFNSIHENLKVHIPVNK